MKKKTSREQVVDRLIIVLLHLHQHAAIVRKDQPEDNFSETDKVLPKQKFPTSRKFVQFSPMFLQPRNVVQMML